MGKINASTLIGLAVTLVSIFVLALWGPMLGLDPWSLNAVRTGAAALGAILLACARPVIEFVKDAITHQDDKAEK